MSDDSFAIRRENGSIAFTDETLLLLKPHRPPMILLDSVVECNLERREIRGIKQVRPDDPYVKAHFPGDSFMPAGFIVEAMAQAAGCLMNLVYLHGRGAGFDHMSVDEFRALDQPPFNVLAETKVKQLDFAYPGDLVELRAKVLLQRKEVFAFQVSSRVGERVVAQGELILAYPPYTPVPDLAQQNGR